MMCRTRSSSKRHPRGVTPEACSVWMRRCALLVPDPQQYM